MLRTRQMPRGYTSARLSICCAGPTTRRYYCTGTALSRAGVEVKGRVPIYITRFDKKILNLGEQIFNLGEQNLDPTFF